MERGRQKRETGKPGTIKNTRVENVGLQKQETKSHGWKMQKRKTRERHAYE